MKHLIKPVEKVIATLVLVVAIGFYSCVLYIIPEFKVMFSDLGTDIPRSTQLYLTHICIGLFFLLSAAEDMQ